MKHCTHFHRFKKRLDTVHLNLGKIKIVFDGIGQVIRQKILFKSITITLPHAVLIYYNKFHFSCQEFSLEKGTPEKEAAI